MFAKFCWCILYSNKLFIEGQPGTPGLPGAPGLPGGPSYQKPSPGYPGSPGMYNNIIWINVEHFNESFN